jgi:phosphatidylglycerophosphatase A
MNEPAATDGAQAGDQNAPGKEPAQATTSLPLGHPACLLATWFGCGLSPIMPGTAGSLGTLPFAWVIQSYFGSLALLGFSISMFFLGWYVSDIYIAKTGKKDDPGEIVIDEVAGQSLLLSCLFPTATSYAIGFVLFRAFDIVKPWPVSKVDRDVGGGLGVMLDDMLAGAYPLLLGAALIAALELCGMSQIATYFMQLLS